jgi:hypothetical protein
MVLREMRAAADAAKHRALSEVASGRSEVPSRPGSFVARRSLSRATERRRSSLSRSIVPPSDDEEAEEEARNTSRSGSSAAESQTRVRLGNWVDPNRVRYQEKEKEKASKHGVTNEREETNIEEEEEEEEEEIQPSQEPRNKFTFHPSLRRKQSALDFKKVWTPEEDAIIREADPAKLKELAKIKGSTAVRKRAIELEH